MQNIIENLPAIANILVSIVGTASLVAAFFGKSDNKYLEYVRKAVNIIAANVGHASNASNVKPTDAAK